MPDSPPAPSAPEGPEGARRPVRSGSGRPIRGLTLPGLFRRALEEYPNDRALYQRLGDGRWRPFSQRELEVAAQEIALGLIESGVERGSRIALFLHSDVDFVRVDLGCLLAGAIDVPIYLTHAVETVSYVLRHSGAVMVVVADADQLQRLAPALAGTEVDTVVLVDAGVDLEQIRASDPIWERVRLRTLASLRGQGARVRVNQEERIGELLDALDPSDPATIVYTSGTTGEPKGVVLSHENLSFNAMTAFTAFPGFRSGARGEVVLSFLPLTHVFARMLNYGLLGHGSTVYYTAPDDLAVDLAFVRPTMFATVPRLLERVEERIRARLDESTGLRRRLLAAAVSIAEQFRTRRPPRGLARLRHALIDLLVFRRWRQALGGRVRYVIAGGAAVRPELVEFFAAAGVPVLQGYGLSEASPVITVNRLEDNRPGTVGQPLAGIEVEVRGGEIVTRGPHVMTGYFRDPVRSQEVVDDQGWLHTGDLGEVVDESFLRVTGRCKDLFKLSTGKYVSPAPLEERLQADPAIEHALVVGAGQKFCAALLFPSSLAGAEHDFEAAVERANAGHDDWDQVKRYAVVDRELTVENGLLTPTLKIKRARLEAELASDIEALYRRQ